MIGRYLIIVLVCCGTWGCQSVPPYVPNVKQLGQSPFGGYIVLTMSDGAKLSGELLAVDGFDLYVAREMDQQGVCVDIRNTDAFLLYFAQPKQYGWSIPFYVMICVSHGVYALATLPINLIVTTAITISGQQAFTYSQKVISLSELSMFSRFPQGLPQGIDPYRKWACDVFLAPDAQD